MLPIAARDIALRLMAREHAAAGSSEDTIAVAEQALRRLSLDLVGWFGPLGAHALVSRALAQVRADHPALATVRVGEPPTPSLEGLAESGRLHGAAAAVAGALDVLAGVVELLGRLIGDTLATTLVEQGSHARVSGGGADGPPAAGGAADTGAAGSATGTIADTTGSLTDD